MRHEAFRLHGPTVPAVPLVLDSPHSGLRFPSDFDAIVSQLDLRDITFFGQDWGGLVGLRLVAAAPERFARVVVGNTGLPTGERPPNDAFLAWQRFSQTAEHFPIGMIVNGGCQTDLPPEVVAAYDAPFPDDTYKAGARIFPLRRSQRITTAGRSFTAR